MSLAGAPQPPPRPARARLGKADRRESLLDAAARLVLTRGIAAVTMEGVAAEAGVSKALPYAHFDNSDEVLVALHQREMGVLGRQVVRAIAAAAGLDDKVRAGVHAFFSVMGERGHLIGILVQAPLTAGPLQRAGTEQSRASEEYFATIFCDELAISRAGARIAAAVVVAGMSGAIGAWARRYGSRRQIEEVVARLVVGGLAAIVEGEANGAIAPKASVVARPPAGVRSSAGRARGDDT